MRDKHMEESDFKLEQDREYLRGVLRKYDPLATTPTPNDYINMAHVGLLSISMLEMVRVIKYWQTITLLNMGLIAIITAVLIYMNG